jgi:acyl-CoA synthetase (NDP forming)
MDMDMDMDTDTNMSDKKSELTPFFAPRSVAVVGASTTFAKWGTIIFHNVILGGFAGGIYPVNQNQREIFGLPAYKTLSDIPGPVDLLMVIVPTEKVNGVLREAGAKGIRAAIIITAGYSETGVSGRRLEEETIRVARQYGIRVLGPNCMGMVSMPVRLTAWMPSYIPESGKISVVTQSGNMGSSIATSVCRRGLGIARVVSTGNEADLTTVDFIDYFSEDPETGMILSYIEGVEDGSGLLRSLRRVSRKKPVVVIKAGSTAAGARASASHTGAMVGSDEIFSTALRSSGVIRARDIEEMVDYAAVLSSQPIPRGNRVGVITLGGGWGVMAADALAQHGLDVVSLRRETVERLNEILPPYWSRSNPVDLVAGLKDGDFKKPLTTLLESDYIDSLMLLGIGYGGLRGRFILSSPYSHLYDMKEIGEFFVSADEATAEAIISLVDVFKKPIIPVVDQRILEEDNRFKEILQEKGILLFPSPLRGAMALSSLVRYGQYVNRGATL